MIQIKRHNLDELANEHCEKIKNRFADAIADMERKGKDDSNYEFKEYWHFLLKNLDIILKGKKNELQKIITQIEKIKEPQFIVKSKSKNAKESLTEEGKLMKAVFNYDEFIKKSEKETDYTAYSFVKNLRVDTCPYCNRTYTNTLSEIVFEEYKKKYKGQLGKNILHDIVRPDLDHFLPKSIYPYLALSFFNLVPACLVCNSRFKGAVRFTFKNNLYPYSEDFGEHVKFKIKIKNVSFFNENLKNNAKIEFCYKNEDGEIEKRAKENIKIFELEKLYNEHLDYVFELVNKAMIYNDDYIDSLFKQFEGSLFRNREDVLRFVTANYVDDDNLHLRPLSKLTKDIVEQFDL